MFDFDASKLLIIGVVALVVIGPKDLPRVLRQVGQMVGKLRRMAAEFQGQFMDAMKEADLADIQKEVSKLKDTASLDVNFNPVHDIRTSIITSVGSTASNANATPAPAAEPALNPFGQDPIGQDPIGQHSIDRDPVGPAMAPAAPVDAPAFAATPAIKGAVSALDADPVYLEPAEAAHHTPAQAAGAVHAVDAGDAGRRRILVPKRRPPGDRLAAKAAVTGRGRPQIPLLPPRRDPRP